MSPLTVVTTDTVQSPQLPTPPPEDDHTKSNSDLLVTIDKLDYHTATDPVTNEVSVLCGWVCSVYCCVCVWMVCVCICGCVWVCV